MPKLRRALNFALGQPSEPAFEQASYPNIREISDVAPVAALRAMANAGAIAEPKVRTAVGPQQLFKRLLLVALLALGLFLQPRQAKAQAMREFVLSCSYGVLAGTLVGAATLAFSSKPGENLNKIARGASLGLYSGILLGLYVTYGGPGEEEDLSVLGQIELHDANPTELRLASSAWHLSRVRVSEKITGGDEVPRLLFAPILSERGIDGATAQLNLLRF